MSVTSAQLATQQDAVINKELEDRVDLQELREVCSATCCMICEAVYKLITGNAVLDPTDICEASRQDKMRVVFLSAG